MASSFILKHLVGLVLFFPFLALGALQEPQPEVRERDNMSPMQQMEVMTPEKLSQREKVVYDQLGPIYQKIYLYAFNDEQRYRVALYVKRGIYPFEAIDVVLRSERRKYEAKKERSKTPAERAMSSSNANKKNFSLF